MDAKEVRADKIDVRGYVGSDRTIQFIFLSFFFFFKLLLPKRRFLAN